MRIHGAARINRFYIRDGWTREAVAELLKKPEDSKAKIKRVILRYTFEGRGTSMREDGIPTKKSEPLYYAIYDQSAIFDKKKVQQHEYCPFEMSGKIYDCDKTFDTKNRWE